MPMQRTGLLLAAALFLCGCAAETGEPVPQKTEEPAPSATAENTTEYDALIADAAALTNYTAGVKLRYDMAYENGSRSVYDLDGVIEEDPPKIHLVQHINADGIQSDTEGWYDGSRLYMTYNTVDYYEDMSADSVRQVMLLPVKPLKVPEEMAESVEKTETDQETVYVFHLKSDPAKQLFDTHYDIYGLNQYENCVMKSGTITQTFDSSGKIAGEETEFVCSLSSKGIGVEITVTSSVRYMKINETVIEITDKQKEDFAAYVNYRDIDTSLITDADVTSDYEEADPIETLKKRLIHRLNYSVNEKGVYQSEFNDTESYAFDFENSIFTYSNRTSHYVYNWRGDQGGFGDTCTIDFNNGAVTEGCDESVVQKMKEVRNYFLMELYYCGLSLDQIRGNEGE
ncbi:MAG: hypothetical protein IKE28_02790 [Solobacterium sp.]|nr:hypothetical protein [Solobacterium sp.]